MSSEKNESRENAGRVNSLIKGGLSTSKACKTVGIHPYTYAKYKGEPAPTEAARAGDKAPSTLIGRVLKCNLSSDDKMALLATVYG